MTARYLGGTLLGTVLVLGAMTGCGGGGGNGDAATDAGGTDATIADCGEAGYVQTTGSGDNFIAQSCSGTGFCPAQVVNDPAHPAFVITQIDVTSPVALHGPPVGTLLNTAISTGLFFWGMSLDTTTNMIRTGALQRGATAQPDEGYLTASFQYYSGNATGTGSPTRWDPVTTTVTVTDDTFTTGTIDLVTVPVYATDSATGTTSLLAELPLRNTHITGARMLAGRECIGLALAHYNSGNSNQWTTHDSMPYSLLEGDITVDDARHITVQITPALSETLCVLLAGLGSAGADGGTSDCENTDMASWPHQPDTTVGTAPAYHLSANFAAVAGTIQ